MRERDQEPLKRCEQLCLTGTTLVEIFETGDSNAFGFLFKRHLELKRQAAERSISQDDLKIHVELTFGLMDAFGEDGLRQICDIYPFSNFAK